MEKSKNNEVTITKVSSSSSASINNKNYNNNNLKKSDYIKSFAESTMNELLGWYGYESNNKHDNTNVKIKKKRVHSESNDSESESVKFTEGCGWCGKSVDENTSVISATAIFCSELCFSQSRRASFKKNKTCDWCRNAKNTITYVDIQDNASQLQFCSDKCLNQYKMHIFCRETKAYLELHPNLRGTESATSTGLITPDLWMKNSAVSAKENSSEISTISSNTETNNNHKNNVLVSDSSLLSLISVAPSTKLLAVDSKRNRVKMSKKFKKCSITSTVTSSQDIPQDLRIKNNLNKNDEDLKMNCCYKKDEEKVSPIIVETANNIINNEEAALKETASILSQILPPPTTFVPYPVILPLPIPIPIPIPIPKMFKSNNNKELIELKNIATQTDVITQVIPENLTTIKIKSENINSEEVPIVDNNNKRLLRKRKPVETKPKPVIKHKKTLSTLP